MKSKRDDREKVRVCVGEAWEGLSVHEEEMKPNIWLMTFLLILILFIIGMTLAYFIVTNNEREVESASDFAKFMTIILICQRKVVV